MTDKNFTWGGHDLEVKPELITIPTATLRRWYESLFGYSESDVPDTVSTRNEIENILLAVGYIKEHYHD